MKKLWAPWRSSYINSLDQKKTGCVFCAILKEKRDQENLIFKRGAYCFAVLNLYPYSNGHFLILPNRHVGSLSKLTVPEQTELMGMTIFVQKLMSKTFKPIGFNLGMNLGRMAGAGIPGHIHMHGVPRWKGDHNFMPVTAQTKVISQSLRLVYKALMHAQSS